MVTSVTTNVRSVADDSVVGRRIAVHLPDEAQEPLCRRVQNLSLPGSRWTIERLSDGPVIGRLVIRLFCGEGPEPSR